ncbi:MAG: response regulator transcription factor [Bacteroidia bacterium]|nr:response regulator transcription factor [Bacteroidia bacterium]MCF8428348.1 response regulator transcription factor [Bacteroidia bacterium]MCF8447651.1 response regulator transcription factor [Bacteroidia bacterium]
MSLDKTPHILIVEDDITLATLLKENLKLAGFSTRLCKDGEEGWQVFQKEKFDLCLLDVNMPKKNGFELAKLIRELDVFTPLVFLTANSSEEDKLKGFGLGADEYMTKPFSTQELLARLKAILKRSTSVKPDILVKEEIYEITGMRIDIPNHLVYFKNSEKKISGTECDLLKLFVKNKGQLLTRNSLLLSVWGRDDFYTARNLDVYINKLRKVLKENEMVEIINVHGSGFKLVENLEQ